MNLPRLEISTTRSEIGLQTERPQLQLRQRPADLQIQQQYLDNLQISKKASMLYIDQTEAFADANLKSVFRFTKEFSQKAHQKALSYIQKQARQGDQLMKIENGNGAIGHIVAQNSQRKPKDINYGTIPKPFAVKINYDPGKTSIRVNRNTVDIQINRNEPQITIPKWQTQAYLKQKNSISFQAVGSQVNRGL
ncbi:hypothetical protein BTR23_11895 [Alkalihalophilus pseudofirmus]|nr:hypothetical protein BTR23_11895 [Alkalihalophilus pseudofirmus]